MLRLDLVCSLVLLAILPVISGVEHKKESRLLEENAFKALLNQQLTHSFNLLAMQQNPAERQATFDIKPVVMPHLEKPESPVEKPQLIEQPATNAPFNPFYANFPLLPAAAQYWPHLAPALPAQYQNYRPGLLNHNRPISAPAAPYYTPDLLYGVQNHAYFGGYPSFIVINPGNFAPHFGSYHNRTPTAAENTPRNLPNSKLLLAKQPSESNGVMDRAASSDVELSSQAEAHMEPIFITAPDTMDDDSLSSEAVMEQARNSPAHNALLEMFLKANQRKQLQEGIAAIYLRKLNLNKK